MDENDDFMAVMAKIGLKGKFQFIAFIVAYYQGIVCGLVTFQAVYISYEPEYRCKIPAFDDNSTFFNLTETSILSYTTPLVDGRYDQCRRFSVDFSLCDKSLDCVNTSAPSTDCVYGYHYDKSVFTSTIVTQFDVVCKRSILFTIESSTYMLAILFGAISSGFLCDRYGRKSVMVVTSALVALFNTAMIFSSSFLMYAILRFIMSINSTGIYQTAFIYLMEVVGTQHRGQFGTAFQSSFAVGYMLWSPIAYIWRDWKQMQIVTSIICLPSIIILLFLPESPIWLFSKGKKEAGMRACRHVAKINGTSAEIDVKLLNECKNDNVEEGDNKLGVCAIFQNTKMRKISVILFYIWFTCSSIYYGIGFNAGELPGDLFISNLYGGTLEIAAYILTAIALGYVGRVTVSIFTLTLAGVCMLASTMLLQLCSLDGYGTLGTVLAFFGKASISSIYSIVYNLNTELYPTVVRGNAVGILGLGDTVGSVLYPYILLLEDYYKWLPGIIFASFALSAGIVCYELPETMKQPTLNTMDEAEQFYQRNRKRLPRICRQKSKYEVTTNSPSQASCSCID